VEADLTHSLTLKRTGLNMRIEHRWLATIVSLWDLFCVTFCECRYGECCHLLLGVDVQSCRSVTRTRQYSTFNLGKDEQLQNTCMLIQEASVIDITNDISPPQPTAIPLLKTSTSLFTTNNNSSGQHPIMTTSLGRPHIKSSKPSKARRASTYSNPNTDKNKNKASPEVGDDFVFSPPPRTSHQDT